MTNHEAISHPFTDQSKLQCLPQKVKFKTYSNKKQYKPDRTYQQLQQQQQQIKSFGSWGGSNLSPPRNKQKREATSLPNIWYILYIHWTYYMYIHIYHDVSIYDMCCFLSQAGKSRLEHNENVFSLNGGLMLPRWGIFVDCVLMNLEVSIFRTLTTTTSWTNIWQESVIDGWFDDVSSGAKNGITQPWYTNHSFSDPNFPLQIAHP